MKLDGIELVRVEIPFLRDIGTAAGVHRMRSMLFIRVVASDGEGWGECAALSEGTSVDPSLSVVVDAAETRGVPRLIAASEARGGELPSGAEVAPLFGNAPDDRQLAAAFEMAVWDAELRTTGLSMAQALEIGPGFEMMPVGAVVGIPADRDVDVVRREVDAAVANGISRVRIKIEPGWVAVPVAAIRSDHQNLVLQVDANGSFDATQDDIDVLSRLADYDVVCVEQPLPPADLIAHAELAKKLPVPICLDESLTSPRRVRDALRNEACAMACLKPGRLGGVRATRAAHSACLEAGVPTFVGGFFEAGLGRASNLTLAARLAQDATGLVSDVGDPTSYLAVDPCGYPPVADGWVRVPDQPGVGKWPDVGVLARLNAQRRWFPATYT
jgi:O-succinylbenzoate synthase